MKTLGYCILLAAIATIWSICGYTYAIGSTEPVEVRVEVPVGVAVEKEWESVAAFGIAPDCSVGQIEPGSDYSGYAYVVEVYINGQGCNSEILLYFPFDSERMVGFPIEIWADEYEIKTTKIRDFEPMVEEQF